MKNIKRNRKLKAMKKKFTRKLQISLLRKYLISIELA